MQIHITALAPIHPAVQRALYTTLELLRVADQKAQLAFDADVDSFELPPHIAALCEKWDKEATSLSNRAAPHLPR